MVIKKRKKRRSRYLGKYPVNSRITIDYAGKKPNVKFDYPEKDKKSVRNQVVFSLPVLIPTLLIAYIFAAILAINVQYPFAQGYPLLDNCEVFLNHWNNSEDFIGLTAECMIEGEVYRMPVEYKRGRKILFLFDEDPRLVSKINSSKGVYRFQIFSAVLNALVVMCISALIIYLLFKFYTKTKLGQRLFPEINKKLYDARYYTKFESVPKNKKIELPLFKNIYLDYNAKKEFGKYLERVEIREHPFDSIIKKGKGKKRYKSRKKGQIFLWKATFFFKEIPKEGCLEIWWT